MKDREHNRTRRGNRRGLCPPTEDQAVGKPAQAMTACSLLVWPVGLMDKASASGAGDSRFESWAGHLLRACRDDLVCPCTTRN